MPIDSALLARSIAALTDLEPERDLTGTLDQAVFTAKQLFMVDAAGITLADNDGTLRSAGASDQRARTLEDSQEHCTAGPCAEAFASGRPVVIRDATLEPRWGEVAHAFAEARIRSGLSVPLRIGGSPIGTLDVYAASPGGWDETEVSALQAYAGVVATLLGAAARATVKSRLAEQLQAALDSSAPAEPAKVAGGIRDGVGAPPLDMAALDAEVLAFLERKPGADGGIGHRLSLLLLGFLGTEVVPLADQLAGLGVDPAPLLASVRDILRLYADTLERPALLDDTPELA
ncbi:MAG TPA: GAF domain-containing protein [Actinomycetes bacterium]|nr:GAF domain-containing protein [Actinomycetes bacterium]